MLLVDGNKFFAETHANDDDGNFLVTHNKCSQFID
jgi:hypothetical protein